MTSLLDAANAEATPATAWAAPCFKIQLRESRYVSASCRISVRYKITVRDPPTLSSQVFTNGSLTYVSESCLATKIKGSTSACIEVKRSVACFEMARTISPEIARDLSLSDSK